MATFVAMNTGRPVLECMQLSYAELARQVESINEVNNPQGEQAMNEKTTVQPKGNTLESMQEEVRRVGPTNVDPAELLKEMTRRGIGSPPPEG